jgi:hydrogenase maturation protease
MNIVVLGIGQSLRGDDAAGPQAVRLWREKYPQTANLPGVRVHTSELPGLGLLDLLAGADAALIVDAVRSGAPAGKLHRLASGDLAAFTPDAGSAHGWGVAETLRLGRSLSPALAACRITLLGIEAGQLEMGAGLSPEVEAALGVLVENIENEVRNLH